MRLSTFKIWVSAGLSLLVVEFLLFVGFAIWTKSQLTRMERESFANAQAWEEETKRLSREMRTVNKKLREQDRNGYDNRSEPELFESSPPPVFSEVKAADLISQYRDAVLSEDKESEKSAAGALRGMGKRGAISLISIISSESTFVKGPFLRLLGSISCHESLGFLQSQLGSQNNKQIQLAILDGLILQPDTSSLPLLKAKLVGVRQEEVRQRILEAMKSIGTAEAARALIFEFENASGSGRSKVLKTMVGMNAEPLTAFFRDVLKNSQNSSFRVMSIRGLVQIGDSTILPVLETIRDGDPDENVKKEADSAIQDLQG